ADGSTPEQGIDEIKRQIKGLVAPGKTLLQLSGGEPTVRDDLPEIVRYAVKAGCKYIQLNTNGLRLAEQRGYARELAEAGLSFVFLQFDALDDKAYLKLRGRKMMLEKLRAIKACASAGLGVALVPMIVPGVNDGQIGDILRFAVKNSPAVRGVHFQPVSYFGRAPQMPDDSGRFTLDELMDAIYTQAPEMVKPGQLRPGCCDHPLCGFHGDFIAVNGRLEAMRGAEANADVRRGSEADRNREFIARRWKRPAGVSGANRDTSTMEGFLAAARECSFTVTAMAFQDAGNLDLERLRRCSLHVYDNGRFVPFCSYYLTAWGNKN
ncbi:MAG: radical SAM protein, partial [Oscillospiraceae bacterium]|nr:radical SAM protein [Oscillospiraceae bacterium]